MDEGPRELVFVYGTLRKGASNHFRMKTASLRGKAWVLGRLYRLGWYPGLVLDDDGIPVRGEVYGVKRERLRELDQFEGEEYERLKFPVYLEGGAQVRAWLYEYRGEADGTKELLPADWLKHGAGDEGSSPPARWSKATFLLLPLTVAMGIGTIWLQPSGSPWLEVLTEFLAGGLPLVPFFTGRLASKRGERLAEGAEVCAAVSFIAFLMLLIARYWPLAIQALPG